MPQPPSGAMVITLTAMASPDNQHVVIDALGDTCRDLLASGHLVGFNFVHGLPASYVLDDNDERVPTGLVKWWTGR